MYYETKKLGTSLQYVCKSLQITLQIILQITLQITEREC
jgi:hypothetical protein